MSPRSSRLSKSRILSGLQCERRLWLETFRRELREVDAGQQMIFDNGNELGELARELYGPGRLIEHVDNVTRALEETAALVDRPRRRVLFEPAFKHNEVVARADVLRPVAGGYELIEVKGSTSVKDYYIDDCATQAWVIENAGVKLKRIRLAHLDNTFVYRGEGDYRGLLHAEDITDRVRQRSVEVPRWVRRFRRMLGASEPATVTGDHCNEPFGCPFLSYCRSLEPPEPTFPVGLLPRGQRIAQALLAEGYRDLRKVPADRLLNPVHQRVHAATVHARPFHDPQVTRVLARLAWPRYYIDFETIAFAVPRWVGTRPYQQIPFQWSCHIERRDGSLEEKAFIDLGGDSPIRAFAESLLAALGEHGPIVVYNQSFEAARIRELAAMLPDLAPRLQRLAPRLFDLLPVTRDGYYHRDMKGSWSIKAVLPTIAPELAYEQLDHVADGSDAQVAYREAIHAQTPPARREVIERALRRYCANDTLGMVRLVEALAAPQGIARTSRTTRRTKGEISKQ